MRNKHLLLVFVAMLGLAFVYPTSLSAQKDKKKKEKKLKTTIIRQHQNYSIGIDYEFR